VTTLYLDVESFCEEPIKSGLHRYAERVEIMTVQWAFDDGPVSVVEFPNADLVQALVDEADEIVIQNSAFDRTVLRHALGVEVPLEKIVDTMVQALAHGLPGSLDKLCDILGVPTDKAKDKAGKQLIQLFCKPRPKNSAVRRATKATHPVEWQRFLGYAASDIPSMREVHKRLPKWNYPGNARERALWVLDQTINDRGVAVDLRFAERAVEAIGIATKRLDARTRAETNGEVESARKRDQLLAHILKDYGVDLPDMQKATLERRIEDPDLPEPVKELLRIRLMTATTSTSKYKALLRSTSSDGRLRGTLQFCGASRTGRWAGRLFQPQNLPRTSKKWKKQVDTAIQAFRDGVVDLAYGEDDVMQAAANCIRGALVAAEDHKLIASDLSNIEGRMLAWLAGEQWKLDAFANGDDLYVLGYSRSFGVPVEEVEADDAAGGTMRLIGKVQELALGYSGAVGAFGKMAAGYGVSLPDARVLEIVKGWRKANAAIVRFWYDLEDAAVRAASSPGRRIECGKLVLQRDGSWLRIRLPSGRYLCYPGVRVEDGKLSYMGTDQYTRVWTRIKTYGGKLVENCTQAAARDVLAWNMPEIEAAGFPIIMSIHDELVTEPLDSGQWTSDRLSSLMSAVPPWAQGLPLAAEGYEAQRYRK
jgi:DNA polymerase